MNSLNKETILIVNDDAEQLETTALYLRRAGYRVLTTSDIRQGFETARQKQIDLIIGDAMLFGGDGIELCQSIRADEELRALPILLVGESPGDVDPMIEKLKIAADVHIESPIEPLRLVTKAARLIERKKVENLFRESDSYFHSLIENVSDIISILSDDGIILYESPAIEQILGYKPDELIGTNAFELIHPDDRERVFSHSKKTVKPEAGKSPEKPFPAEYRYQTKKGSWRILESTGKMINDPTIGTVVIINSRDVTEQRKAEKSRRRSEEKFRRVLENSRDVIYQLNLKTKNFDYISPATKEISGYSAEELMEGGFSFINSLVHPEDWNFFREYIDRIQNTAETDNTDYSIEYRFKTKEKGYRWLSENRTVVRDENQSPLAIIATARDITERRQTEQNIRFQAHLLNTVEQAVIATNVDCDVVCWNRFAQKLYGWTPEEANGRGIIELTTPHPSRGQAEEIMSQLRAGKGWTGEFDVQNQNGAVFPAIVTNSPILDDNENLIGIVGISNDISERKLAERKIKESEEQYRFLSEAVPQQVWSALPEGSLDYANRRSFDYFGFEAEQGRRDGWQQYVHPDDLAACVECWNRSLETGEPYQVEFRLKRSDGEYQWHLGRATAMRNQDGEIIKWIGINTNIDELKKAEAALLEANKRAVGEYERLLDRIVKLSESFGTARDLQTIYRALHAFAVASCACPGFVISLDDAERNAPRGLYV
ncbi:MAG: PAS domain S-box protein [Acidobacteriota bacterium]|nr:PAS domain S-box protein [Acidobacteriota bacterium]